MHAPNDVTNDVTTLGDPTDSGFRLGYRPALDGLRGVALVVVVLFHAQVPWIAAGHMGLTVFFVLSAFLVTVLVLQEWRDAGTVRLGNFYARRFLRIYPALVLFVLAVGVFVAATASPATARAQWLSGASVLAGVANIQHSVSYHPLLLLEHTWSIAVELQFYVVWPLVLLWALRRGTDWRRLVAWMVAISLLVLVVRGLWWNQRWTQARLYPRILTGTDMRVDHLLIGCLLGIAAVRGHLDRLRPYRRAVVAASAVAVAYLAWFTVAVDVDRWDFMFAGGSTLVALAAAMIVVAIVVAADSPVPRALGNRVLVWLGTISYGVYLWHVPLYRILRERAPDWPLWQKATVGGLAAVLLALLSYHGVERWALAQKRRFTPARRAGRLDEQRTPLATGR